MSNLTTLFSAYRESKTPIVIELLSHTGDIIGAINLSELRYHDLVVSETKTSERYMILIDGISIFFTTFKKLEK